VQASACNSIAFVVFDSKLRRFARGLAVRSGRKMERRAITPFHSQRIAHWGACGKTRVVAQNRSPRPAPTKMGVANAGVVIDVRVARDVEPMVGFAVQVWGVAACALLDAVSRERLTA